MDRQLLWDQLADILSNACAREKPRLDPDTSIQVEEFIEHREYGLAFEWLVEAFERQGMGSSDQTRAELIKAAYLMNLPLPSYL